MEMKTRKSVMNMFTYGVYILSAKYKGEYCASLISMVTQNSIDPLLISVCLKHSTDTHLLASKSKHFVLHIPDENQIEFSKSFMKPTSEDKGKLNGYDYKLNNYNQPIFNEANVYLECEIIDSIDIGDHPLFVAKVNNIVQRKQVNPLEMRKVGWTYGH